MRGVQVELPEVAQGKLLALQMARGAADDLARSATARLNNRDADPRMREALAAEQSKQQGRFNELNQLHHRIQQFLAELRPGAVLEPAPPVTAELRPGEKLIDAVEGVRRDLEEVARRLAAIKASPLPQAEQSALVEAYVVDKMRSATPNVSILRDDKLRISWRGDTAAVEDVVGLLCLIAPEHVCRAIERQLAAQPERAGAMSKIERLEKQASAEARLLELERAEESLIMQAAAAGQEILRRPYASPLAVLGVVIAQAQAQVA